MSKFHFVPPDLVKKVEAMKARLQALQEVEQTSLQPAMDEAKGMEESLREGSSSEHPTLLGRLFARL